MIPPNQLEIAVHNNAQILLWFCIIIIIAIFALLVRKISQPAVLGQILAGAGIGVLAHYNIIFSATIIKSPVISFFAELGSIIMMFEIGLESNLSDIKASGKNASIVALTGAIVPFLVGALVVTPLVMGSTSFNLSLFVGSMLAVTSTGVSVSVFKDLGILKSPTAQVVLAASVIDDALGLILLSVVSGILVSNQFSFFNLGTILLNVIIFFAVSYLISRFILPFVIKKGLIKISGTYDTIPLILLAIALSMSCFAQYIGLAPIIGAFVAGIIIDEAFFDNYSVKGAAKTKNNSSHQSNHHKLSDMVEVISSIFTPLFFIYAGMQVDLIGAFSNWKIILLALVISVFAIFSKAICGIFLPKGVNKWLVGFGMVPRGEIGIIFAISGLAMNVINNDTFTAFLLMIVITSICAPIAISLIARKKPKV